jgi:hypothetical protein
MYMVNDHAFDLTLNTSGGAYRPLWPKIRFFGNVDAVLPNQLKPGQRKKPQPRNLKMETKTITLTLINAGGVAKLSNGSFWRIAPGQLVLASTWIPGTEVAVEPSGGPIWQHTLTNLESRVQVSAARSDVTF